MDDGGLRQDLSEKSLEQGRNFLSALFMAVRTAQIHDPGNKAFVHAVDMVHRSAEVLFTSTGGFSVQFVEDVAFLNGLRLRFETSAFAAVRTLRRIFEQHDLGGIAMRTPPSRTAIHRLILLFATSRSGEPEVTKEDLGDLEIGLLGVQQFADRAGNVQVDRRVFAVQCYAKLVLAVREQVERLRAAARNTGSETGKPPRLRAVRVIQDLVELCGERPDFLLRLSSNRHGASPIELAGANACTLAIAIGYAIGFDRQSLVDLGVAGLFHHLDTGLGRPIPVDATGAPAAIAQLLSEGGVGSSSYTRAFVVAERPTLDGQPRPATEAHPFSRLLGVVVAYDQLISGFGRAEPSHPLDALAFLYNDEARFDRRLVDLLINVLRAFPAGVEVLLDDGRPARVHTQAGGSRWDRPVVSILGESPQQVDLMVRRDGRFLHRIVATRVFVEAGASREGSLPVTHRPPLRTTNGSPPELSEDDLRSTLEDLAPPEGADPFDEAISEG